MHDPAARETVDERLRMKLIVQLPTLLGEIRAASSILKGARLRRDGALSAATVDIPADVASDMRAAGEAADHKQFFICSQTITTATSMLQQLEEDIRRSLEMSTPSTPAASRQTVVGEQEHARRRWCAYLEQALDLLYALNWELHMVKLATNALYLHGQDPAPGEPQLQETDGLKDAIARLVSTIATKHFGPNTTSPARSPPPVDQ